MNIEIPWFAIPASLLLGGFLSWLVYRNKLNNQRVKGLFILRLISWTLLLLLLFKPYILFKIHKDVRPKLRVYRDASTSSDVESRKYLAVLDSIVRNEFNNEMDIEVVAFGKDLLAESLDSAIYGNQTARLIGSETRFQDVARDLSDPDVSTHTAGSIILTDGIINSGASPLNEKRTNKKPVLIIGTGDSSILPDVSVSQLICNPEVFLGNSSKMEVEVEFQNIKQRNIRLELLDNGKVIQTKQIVLESQNNRVASNRLVRGRRNVTFDYVGKEFGQHLIQVKSISVEDNNPYNDVLAQNIQVIDRRKKIAVVYGKPHPDIKAIAESLGSTIQNEILLLSENEQLPIADVFVLHGIENARTFEQVLQRKKPYWIFTNTPASLVFANQNSGVSVNNISRIVNYQSVGIYPNADFTLFESVNSGSMINSVSSISSSQKNKIQNIWGGVSAALVKLKSNSNQSIQMFQVWNNSLTDFPICSVNNQSEVFSFWFWGEGIWRCRINEYRKLQSLMMFDQWVNNNVQWLSSNSDSYKELEIITSNDECQLGGVCRFKVIRRDGAGNKTNREDLTAKVVYKNGKTKELLLVRSNDEYAGSFKPEFDGVLQIMISLKNKANIKAEKKIMVNSFSIEQRTTQSDFEFLRRWSKHVNGEFLSTPLTAKKSENAQTELEDFKNKVVNWIQKKRLNQLRIEEKIEKVSLKQWWIYLFIVAAFFGSEWLLRKRFGLES